MNIPSDPETSREIRKKILRDIIEQLDKGEKPDTRELKKRFSECEEEIVRLCRAASDYRSIRSVMKTEKGGLLKIEPGVVIGDFEVEGFLARGGMGTVYRARQISLGSRPVALKILPIENVRARDRSRFRKEAKAAASLHHPHLAEVYGFNSSDEFLYYAMRLVEGPTLQDVLNKLSKDHNTRSDLEIRRRIVKRVYEVASALSEVHRAGIIHRDVKPGNIILEGGDENTDLVPDYPAVLVDFGLVRSIDPEVHTQTCTSTATPAYAAPEILLGKDLDARTDVFSIGVTLHDLLAHRNPIDRIQASAGLDPIEELVSNMDKDLAAIVSRAVDPMHEWRYPDASGFMKDLEAWMDGRPVLARRRGFIESTIYFLKRHPWKAIIAMASAAMLFLVAYLIVSFCWKMVNMADKAEAAYQAGDISSLFDSLESLSSSFGGFFFLEQSLQSLAGQIRGNDEHPANRVYEFLENGKKVEALTEAASNLWHDKTRYPIIDRFFRSALNTHEEVETRREALMLCARIFLENFDKTPLDSAMSKEYQKSLLRIWRNNEFPLNDRLWALSALGGCGTPNLVLEIMDWAINHPPESEPQRLGVAISSLILDRTRLFGTADVLSIDEFEGLAEKANTYLKKYESEPFATHWLNGVHINQAWKCFLLSLGLYHKHLKIRVVNYDVVTTHFSDINKMHLLSVFNKKGIVGHLLNARYPGNDQEIKPTILGHCCALYGDEQVSDNVLTNCLNRAQGDLQELDRIRERFNEGKNNFNFVINKEDFTTHIDEETYLTRQNNEDYVTINMETSYRDQCKRESALAAWDFRKMKPWIEGAACSKVSTHSVIYKEWPDEGDDNRSHIRLIRPNISDITLRFTESENINGKCLFLYLDHCRGYRLYFPKGGIAEIEVCIDDLLKKRIDIYFDDFNMSYFYALDKIHFTLDLIEDRVHEITIKMINSTTTYWLREAWIEVQKESSTK